MIKVFHLFRRPTYPLICNINNNLIAARTKNAFEKAIGKYELEGKNHDVIDATGEGWMLYTKQMMISPVTLKKYWSKMEVISLYNNSRNILELYQERSLSNKKYDSLFDDIVKLIIKKQKRKIKPTQLLIVPIVLEI